MTLGEPLGLLFTLQEDSWETDDILKYQGETKITISRQLPIHFLDRISKYHRFHQVTKHLNVLRVTNTFSHSEFSREHILKNTLTLLIVTSGWGCSFRQLVAFMLQVISDAL